MTHREFMAALFSFILFAGLTLLLSRYMAKRYRVRLILAQFNQGRRVFDAARARLWLRAAVMRWVVPLGRTAAPKKEAERLRTINTLKQAGYTSRDLVPLEVYFGVRVLLAAGFGLCYFGWLLFAGNYDHAGVVKVFFPLGAGYYLPSAVLRYQASRRSRRIWQEVPDVLDLLRICTEAGLGLDKALFRVSREVRGIAPVLSRELSRYFLEIRSGLPRREVLAGLAERNQVNALSAVVNLLLQSNRLGTDISEALRIHSLSLRTERIQIAEEQGAKVSIKLVFPLVFLILPALLIVILGPAMIGMFDRLGKLF